MKKRIKKPKLLYKYIVCYGIVLLIPVLVFTYIINNRFLPVFWNQIISGNHENLRVAKEQIEQKIEEMNKIAISISENPRLSPYMIRKNFYGAYEGVSELRDYKYGNEIIYDILYYIRGEKRIYGAYQSWQMSMLIGEIYRFDNWELTQFCSDVNSLVAPVIRPTEKINGDYLGELELIPYIYPIKPYTPYATIVFLIDNTQFKNMLRSVLKEYNENVYILNNDNNVITALKGKDELSDKEFKCILDRIEDAPDDDVFLIDDYFISHIKSNRHKWTYISIVRNDRIMDTVNTLKKEIYGLILVIFMFGTMFIIGLSYMNYKPVNKLQKKVARNLGFKDNTDIKFEDMGKVFDEIWEVNARLRQDVNRYKPILREYVLRELIKGNMIGFNDVMEIGQKLDLYSSSQMDFQVMVFKFQNHDMAANWNYTLGKKMVTKSIEMKLDDNIRVYGINQEEEDYFIVILGVCRDLNNCPQWNESIRDTIKCITKEIKNEYNIDLIVSVGNVYEDILSIGNSYTEAIEMLMQVELNNKSNILFFSEYSKKKEACHIDYVHPYAQLKKISAQINIGKIESVSSSFNKLMEELKRKRLPRFLYQCIVFDIYNILIKKGIDLNIDMQGHMEQDLRIFTSDKTEDYEKLYNKLFNMCQEICDHVMNQRSYTSELLDNVINYIEDNYYKYEISLREIAEYVGITPSYLSNIFKEMTGNTISDYIWNMRVKHAKHLLKTTKIPIKDIVEKIGYINASSFTRKFKKKEGLTPGQYRWKSQI